MQGGRLAEVICFAEYRLGYVPITRVHWRVDEWFTGSGDGDRNGAFDLTDFDRGLIQPLLPNKPRGVGLAPVSPDTQAVAV